MSTTIEVAIIEDDRELRELLQTVIDAAPDMACSRLYASAESGVPALLRQATDVLLMDIDLLHQTGIEAVRHLIAKGYPNPILMLTVHEDVEAVFDSLCAGATGYLVKGLPPSRLLTAIRDVYDGGAPMTPRIARQVVRSFRRSPTPTLTEREGEVLQLLCDGENYRSIAERLFISTNTVKVHIKHIYEKLQVHTRAEAVRKAMQDKLVR